MPDSGSRTGPLRGPRTTRPIHPPSFRILKQAHQAT
jgi:hypothetical protein